MVLLCEARKWNCQMGSPLWRSHLMMEWTDFTKLGLKEGWRDGKEICKVAFVTLQFPCNRNILDENQYEEMR